MDSVVIKLRCCRFMSEVCVNDNQIGDAVGGYRSVQPKKNMSVRFSHRREPGGHQGGERVCSPRWSKCIRAQTTETILEGATGWIS